MDKLRVVSLAVSLCLSLAPAYGQILQTHEGSASVPDTSGEDVARLPMAANQTDGESAFKVWDRYARNITTALEANDVKKAEACTVELKSEAQKTNSHAGMAVVYCATGWIQDHNRQFEPAILSFEASLVEFQKHGTKPQDLRYAAACRWLVISYMGANRTKEALRVSTELIKNDREAKAAAPSFGRDLYANAQCNFRLGQYSEAENSAQEAGKQLLFAAPPSERTTTALIKSMQIAAESQNMLGKYDDAENACKMALALEYQYHSAKSPLVNRMQLDLSRAQIGCGKFTEAEMTLASVIPALSPQGGWPYVSCLSELAKLQAEQARFADAVETYGKAADALSASADLRHSPHALSVYALYAVALSHVGRISEAEEYLKQASACASPVDGSATKWTSFVLYQLAGLYRQKGDRAQAKQTTERFVATRDSIVQAQLGGGAVKDVCLDGQQVSGIQKWVVCSEQHQTEINKSPLARSVIAKLTAGLSAVPEAVQQRLRTSGVEIVVLPNMQGIIGERESRPAGYYNGATSCNEQARTSSDTAAVFMAEQYKTGNSQVWVESPDARDSVRHELGHALDHYLMAYSDREEFVKAYADDTKEMAPSLRTPLSYLLQHGSRGRLETFADLAALEWGASARATELRAGFPQCIKVLKKCLADLDSATEIHKSEDRTIGMTSDAH